MLKIKDNVDLKELEKFGFKKCDEMYNYGRYEYFINPLNQIMIWYDTREIKYDINIWTQTIEDMEQFDRNLESVKHIIKTSKDKIQELVEADLVEKIEN